MVILQDKTTISEYNFSSVLLYQKCQIFMGLRKYPEGLKYIIIDYKNFDL